MRHVLVGLDGSPLAETVLPFVEMLARKSGARITLLHVVHMPEQVPAGGTPSAEEIGRHLRQLAEAYLLEQQRRMVAADVDTRIAVAAGSPARAIVDYAGREGCDVIALATHGRSGVQRWAHGSVADGVLQLADLPLLLVRPDEGWSAAPRKVHRIVVPLDGSPEAATALALAAPLATRFAVPLVLLRFVEPVVDFGAGPGGMGALDIAGITQPLLDTAHAELDATATTLRGRGLAAECVVDLAAPAAGIADHTHAHPGSLVVMTTRGRSGWQRLLLGSVARRVVHTVAAPILLCPPPK